jgi:hypothetical protein
MAASFDPSGRRWRLRDVAAIALAIGASAIGARVPIASGHGLDRSVRGFSGMRERVCNAARLEVPEPQ